MDEDADGAGSLAVGEQDGGPGGEDGSVEVGEHHAETGSADVGGGDEAVAGVEAEQLGRPSAAGFAVADRLDQAESFKVGDAAGDGGRTES